jgi:5-methylcytosine-specific restriction endonuclease McrA
MVHRPRLRVKLARREIFRRDNFTCQYCGKRSGELTVDHIIPRHLGGQHTWSNVVTACAQCNHRKGGRTLAEAGMQLTRQPAEPPASALYIFGRHLTEYAEWEPFLLGW